MIADRRHSLACFAEYAPSAVPGINPSRTECSNRCEQRFQFSAPHSGGIYGVFCDGHVALVPEAVDAMILRAMVTRSGGDIVEGKP